MSHEQNGFKWLLFQYTICTQLPVMKPSASTTTYNMIGHFCVIGLNLSCSSLVVVAKYYTQDDFQQYPNNTYFALV